MLYEFLFQCFDSVPTWSFSLYFLSAYLFLHLAVYQLLLLSRRFHDSMTLCPPENPPKSREVRL